jgi:formate-dependent nitrite reductase membrane component NrfD
VLAAGADLTGRGALRRSARLTSLGALAASSYFLVADLGRPERFLNMLRVAKPTSPMSVGSWLLMAYAPGVGIAALDEVVPARWRPVPLARSAGVAAAVLAPAVASYTAVLVSQTAVPLWHEARRELPFVFTASAAASAGGLAAVLAPTGEAGPARRFAVYGAVVELLASRRLHRRLGELAEPLETGRAARHVRRAHALTAAGALGMVAAGGRRRWVTVASGLALAAGSALQRFGILEAGRESATDPRYVVIQQRTPRF